jgi:hypothetical protein
MAKERISRTGASHHRPRPARLTFATCRIIQRRATSATARPANATGAPPSSAVAISPHTTAWVTALPKNPAGSIERIVRAQRNSREKSSCALVSTQPWDTSKSETMLRRPVRRTAAPIA